MTARSCLDCGRITTSGSRCADHQAAYLRRRELARGTRTERGYSNEWLRLSRAAIAASPYCAVPGCTSTDLTADHPVALANGGAPLPDAVIVLCRSHNAQKGSGELRI